MILEVRTYTFNVGKVRIWLDYYEKHGLPVQERHLGRLVGFFTSETGRLNQVVHMRAYDSFADRETRRAAMLRDPAWLDVLKNEPPGLIVSQESQILQPTSFSPLR